MFVISPHIILILVTFVGIIGALTFIYLNELGVATGFCVLCAIGAIVIHFGEQTGNIFFIIKGEQNTLDWILTGLLTVVSIVLGIAWVFIGKARCLYCDKWFTGRMINREKFDNGAIIQTFQCNNCRKTWKRDERSRRDD